MPIYGSASYAVCGSGGIPQAQFRSCVASPPNSLPANSFDTLDCCSLCANTLDCYQAYTDGSTNLCTIEIRIGSNGDNTNRTSDCPNFHTFVIYGDKPAETNVFGLIAGHCSQGC